MYSTAFLPCGSMPLGIYPLVDRAEKLPLLFANGITTAQLRIKDLSGEALRFQIQQAIGFAEQANARLFINDAWQAAIEFGAYGVHLGQEDCQQLQAEDVFAMHQAGLRLGISTHTSDEIAFASALQPSYIAIGPVFATQSKALDYEMVGLANLKLWIEQLTCPVVAIGGINESNLAQVVACGVEGIAMIGGWQDPAHAFKRSASENSQALVAEFERAWQRLRGFN